MEEAYLIFLGLSFPTFSIKTEGEYSVISCPWSLCASAGFPSPPFLPTCFLDLSFCPSLPIHHPFNHLPSLSVHSSIKHASSSSLFIHSSIHPSVPLHPSLSIPPIYPSIPFYPSLSIHPSIPLPIHSSVYPSLPICPSIHPSLLPAPPYAPVHPSVYPPVHLPIIHHSVHQLSFKRGCHVRETALHAVLWGEGGCVLCHCPSLPLSPYGMWAGCQAPGRWASLLVPSFDTPFSSIT